MSGTAPVVGAGPAALAGPAGAAAPDEGAPPALSPEAFAEVASRIESELGKLIVGQGELVRDTLVALLAGGHVLLEGVPGLGKTSLVRALGQVLELTFGRVQFTPDLMPADITGTTVIYEDESGRSFDFQPGPTPVRGERSRFHNDGFF